MRAIVVSCLVLAAACGSQKPTAPRPLVGALPPNTHVNLAGTFTFSQAGELTLALAEPCSVGRESVYGTMNDKVTRCDRAHLDAARVVAVTPWRTEVPGVWTDASHLVFRIDWKQSGLDPLTDDAAALVTRPWAISSTRWTPTQVEADRILKLVGDATDTEADLVRGGAAPSLEVTSFEVGDGSLRAGGEATLVVKVVNRGPGTAYRVVATTRSSVASLHGQRLTFGMIKPRSEKVRRLRVTVPSSETSPDTMLVLVMSEGNGFMPKNVSRRVPIAASATASTLAVRCSIVGRTGARPDLDAGDNVVLRCTVDNTGSAVKLDLEASVAGRATPAQAQDVAAAGHASFDVPVAIPRELAIDSPVEIAVTVHDRQFVRTARTSVVGVVRKPKLCAAGQLTRAQYRAKMAELRAAVAAGDLTQAQLDKYDAELVTCLK
jgi:hypothetical protein